MKSVFTASRTHRALLVAALLAVSCFAVRAQNDGPPPGDPPSGQMRGRGPNIDRQLQMLTERLSLTSDQQAQVKTILTDQRQKMEELRKSSSASDASGQAAPPRREQMEAIRNDTDSKITALLNDDQKTRYAAMQQQRKERMERRGGDGPPPLLRRRLRPIKPHSTRTAWSAQNKWVAWKSRRPICPFRAT